MVKLYVMFSEVIMEDLYNFCKQKYPKYISPKVYVLIYTKNGKNLIGWPLNAKQVAWIIVRL